MDIVDIKKTVKVLEQNLVGQTPQVIGCLLEIAGPIELTEHCRKDKNETIVHDASYTVMMQFWGAGLSGQPYQTLSFNQ